MMSSTCPKMPSQRVVARPWDCSEVQSLRVTFRAITTPSVDVPLDVGAKRQGDGELDKNGRMLLNLEFGQVGIGLHGLLLEKPSSSETLCETVCPVFHKDGCTLMEGYDAYRMSNVFETHSILLDKKKFQAKVENDATMSGTWMMRPCVIYHAVVVE